MLLSASTTIEPPAVSGADSVTSVGSIQMFSSSGPSTAMIPTPDTVTAPAASIFTAVSPPGTASASTLFAFASMSITAASPPVVIRTPPFVARI